MAYVDLGLELEIGSGKVLVVEYGSSERSMGSFGRRRKLLRVVGDEGSKEKMR